MSREIEVWRLGRVEYEDGFVEADDRAIGEFDFDAELPISNAAEQAYLRNPIAGLPSIDVRGGSLYAGLNGAPRELSKGQYSVMPRLGAVWKLNDKTVVRGGYGLFYDTNNYKEAIPYYERALRKDPSQNDVRVDLGVSHHYAGNPQMALPLLREAVRVDSTHAIAWFDLAIIQESLGMREEARQNFLRARALPGPEAMGHVIDQMLARSDSAAAATAP